MSGNHERLSVFRNRSKNCGHLRSQRFTLGPRWQPRGSRLRLFQSVAMGRDASTMKPFSRSKRRIAVERGRRQRRVWFGVPVSRMLGGAALTRRKSMTSYTSNVARALVLWISLVDVAVTSAQQAGQMTAQTQWDRQTINAIAMLEKTAVRRGNDFYTEFTLQSTRYCNT
jgi:hypothetical protein